MNREERAEVIDRYIDELVELNDDFSSEKKYLCPVCQTELNVQAGKYQRGDRQMIGIIVKCIECDVTMAIDYGVGEQ